ncbi:hypothetical protein ACGFJ7_23015 [Actinoplanes sp. NPDC048988]|uniref:hypothetical protein n=1 Tax=Actinoplanes sp. NPDC048988 TaxID=3363901 RepID=UPI00372435BE
MTAGKPVAVPSVAASAAPLDSARATALSKQLTSGDEAQLRRALAVPPGQALEPAAAGQLASLGSITFDLGSFRYLDGRTARLRGQVATPPAGTDAEWTFTLAHLGPQWMLVDGRPAA